EVCESLHGDRDGPQHRPPQITGTPLQNQGPTPGNLAVGPSLVEGFVKAFTFTSNPQQYQGEVAAMDWRHNAVCREGDPELVFPTANTGPARLEIVEAESVRLPPDLPPLLTA